ncbi:MAG: molecular chaperone DnaK [Hyphococcus sp.]|nr:MAG: molecular chaperone DnaK [Marinicaulis sp.]
MNETDRARFKKLLEMRREELSALSSGSADARKPVELDQQSVGRLSRQDALQQQAMAKAQETRRIAEAHKIEAALTRIKEGEFGYCADCGEAIAAKRLEINLTTELCIQCAGGAQQ